MTGKQVHVESCVYGTKSLSAEVEGAWLPEHAAGEDVDAPPAQRRRATEHVESGFPRQLSGPDLGQFPGDLGDPVLHLRAHLGQVFAQGLGKDSRQKGERAEKKRGEDHGAQTQRRSCGT
jgi:hypothetical protein